MRVCNTCGEAKPLDAYRIVTDRKSGKQYHRRRCKKCQNKITAQHPSRHTDEFRKYQREHKRRHRKTARGREVYRKSNDKYNENNPEKRRAWWKASLAVPLTGLCGKCKKRPAEVRHHEDYDKPEEVQLLCRRCHKSLDDVCTADHLSAGSQGGNS